MFESGHDQPGHWPHDGAPRGNLPHAGENMSQEGVRPALHRDDSCGGVPTAPAGLERAPPEVSRAESGVTAAIGAPGLVAGGELRSHAAAATTLASAPEVAVTKAAASEEKKGLRHSDMIAGAVFPERTRTWQVISDFGKRY